MELLLFLVIVHYYLHILLFIHLDIILVVFIALINILISLVFIISLVLLIILYLLITLPFRTFFFFGQHLVDVLDILKHLQPFTK